MTLGQIHDMDVVTDCSAVLGLVVTAINIEVGTNSKSNLLDVRHQVVGDANRMLSNQACIVTQSALESFCNFKRTRACMHA